MPKKTVKLKSGPECGGLKTIIADPPNIVLPNDSWKIRFKNQLDGGVDAEVRFFEADDKGGYVISDFCDGMTDPDVLTVPGSDKEICEPDDAGDFAYTVQAAGHEELDPIIIIKPDAPAFFASPAKPDTGLFPGGEFSAYALLALSAPLFVGILVGIYIGRKMTK